MTVKGHFRSDSLALAVDWAQSPVNGAVHRETASCQR